MSKFSDTPESKLVSHLIGSHQDNVADRGYYDRMVRVEPEAHYNYYGDRGVADLYVELAGSIDGREFTEGTVYEVKSEHAVKEANGAGDIIRQFNRMSRYFFQDETWDHPGDVTYELTFIPTPATIQHVEENKELYKQVSDIEENKVVLFRTPDDTRGPGIPFMDDFDTVSECLAYSNGGECARAGGVDQEIIDAVRDTIGE